jgi:hypothetical protein
MASEEAVGCIWDSKPSTNEKRRSIVFFVTVGGKEWTQALAENEQRKADSFFEALKIKRGLQKEIKENKRGVEDLTRDRTRAFQRAKTADDVEDLLALLHPHDSESNTAVDSTYFRSKSFFHETYIFLYNLI